MDLDNELGIPPKATLSPSISAPVQFTFEGNNNLDELLTIPACYGSNDSLSISVASSIRKSSNGTTIQPRALIIGRQASSSDIRVDHKSVSRRHTALYYVSTLQDVVDLVIKDLGGKHGTTVNGVRIKKNESVQISVRGESQKEHIIQFGNAPLKCRLIFPHVNNHQEGFQQSAVKDDLTDGESRSDDVVSEVNAININAETGQQAAESSETDTRESREAQIAAMIASFDAAPAYKKYVPTAEDDIRSELPKAVTQAAAMQQTTANNKYNLPITASISLSPGSNSFSSSDGTNTPLQVNSSVSALCFEPSGARLVAGHRDGTLRFYDFHSMKPSLSSASDSVYYTPFRIVDSDNDPLDSTGRHVLTCLGPSPTGASWIVGTTSSQPKVIDREGSATLFNFVKGDNYVTDSSNTKGHTAPVTGVGFHPLIKDICFTCSRDGSIRQWDVSGRGKTVFQKWLVCQKVIGKCKNDKGQRTQITSNIGIHPNGRKIVVGTSCGSIQVWNCFGNGINTRPLGAVYSAHGEMKPVTYVTFSNDGNRIASRSDQDNTVRVWDAHEVERYDAAMSRKLNNRRGNNDLRHSSSLLLAVCKGLDALNEIPNCAFSPDGKFICAGTSINPRDTSASACGQLKFYQLPEEETEKSKDKKDVLFLEPVDELDIAPNASILGVAWHPKLNQIALGTSNGG